MNKLETKTNELLHDYLKKHGDKPEYADAYIRWKDSKKVELVKIGLCYYVVDDDETFFYYDCPETLVSQVCPIDFDTTDFDTIEDFEEELNKYDTEEDRDYYFPNEEDFDIVDVVCLYE